MAQRKRGWIRLLIPQGQIPGVSNDSAGGLIEGRPSRRFLRHRSGIARQRQAERNLANEMAPHGLRVFDRNAGQAELGSYLAPRK